MKNSHSPDLTSGSIRSQLWSLSWPMMLSGFFYTFYNLVDAFWVSKLSEDAIAAVSISQITLFLMISLGFGITIGSGVVMSMDIGAKNKEGAEKVLGQSFVLTTILGVLFTAIALVFREPLLAASGASGDIFKPALDYFTVTSAGSTLFFILITIMFAFNAQGDTFTLTKMFAVSTLVNLVLDPVFIFGYGGLPEMGIAGAGVATLISQFTFILIGLYVLSRPSRSIQFHFRNLGFKWESVKEVLRIGVPAALTQVINPVGMAALTLVSSTYFAEAGAVAFSLGFRVEFLAYLPAMGFGFGAMAMVGQSIGAKNIERAREVLKVALKYSGGIALGMGLLAFFFGGVIVDLFSVDAEAATYALGYFRIVSVSYLFLACMMVIASTFQALGESWPGFWIAFTRYCVVCIPLSLLLVAKLGIGINGIWISLALGNIVAAILGYFWLTHKMAKFSFKHVEDAVSHS